MEAATAQVGLKKPGGASMEAATAQERRERIRAEKWRAEKATLAPERIWKRPAEVKGVKDRIRKLAQRREGEHQRLRQLHRVAQPLRQPVAQFDRAERVEPRLHQRRVGRGARQQLGRHLAHCR